jgi:carbon-monoxide dehydrogenase medium subunit/xanthine dehydrogenase FAD-binding subunit
VRADSTGTMFEDVRLALGGVGPRPIRLRDAERRLKGERITQELIQRVAESAADSVGSRSRKEYRRDVVVNFVRAGLEEALANQPEIGAKFKNFGETENA